MQISGAIEGTGGTLNAGTEQELTVYWCKVAQPHFDESLDLLVDMLRNSLFEQDSIDKERMVILEELAMINDYPGARVDSLIDEMLWPEHPLGRDIGEAAIQTHGGVGMTDEVSIGHFHKRILTINALFGDSEYHFRAVGKSLATAKA